MGEDRPLAGHELAAPLVVDQRADEVGGQQVGGELDALEVDRERLGQGLDGERLGEAGHALDQHVAAGEQADQQAVEQVVLADDDLAQLGLDPLEGERLALEVAVQAWRRPVP